MDVECIGRNIARLRTLRGISQGDLGKEIGLTPSAISNIENAISYPSIDTLIKFAEFFSVTMDYLLTNKGIEQLEELQLKSKLLTTEIFLRTGKSQKSLYEINNKEYFFEEKQHEITYKISEADK